MTKSVASRSRDSKKRQWGLYNTPDPKAAWRAYQPAGSEVAKPSTAMDTEGMTEQLGPDTPLELSQIEKARKTMSETVERAGGDAAMLDETFKMLGIHPTQKSELSSLMINDLPNPGSVQPLLGKRRKVVTQK